MKGRLLLITLLVGSVVYAQPAPAPAPDPGTPAHEPAPTGPGLGVPQTPPKPVVAPPLQLTDKELKELKDVEADYDTFTKAADENDRRMRDIAKHEYDARTGELEKRYAERIAKTEADRVKRHADTIALLEKFLQNHPNHEQFTPDAMFRLADLYLDQADDEVEARLTAQENAGSAASNNPDSAAIVADYSKSLALWEDILKRFPNYRQTPSTLYLLAYYGKTKDERRSSLILP